MAEPTPAEIEAGAQAMPADPDNGTTVVGWQMERDPEDFPYHVPLWGDPRQVVAAVLAAVLPDHDAELERRVRARVAEEIAEVAEAYALRLHGTAAAVLRAGAHHAAAMLRQHASPPTTEGDHHER